MKQMLISFPVFISLITLFYFTFLPSKNKVGLRFLPYILLSFIARNLFLLYVYYKSLFTPNYEAASPPLTIISLSLLFLFMMELVTQKKVSRFILYLNLLPAFIGIVFYIIMMSSQQLQVKWDYAHYILKNTTGAILACIYFVIIYTKQLNKAKKLPHQKLISLLLLQVGIIISLFTTTFIIIFQTKSIVIAPFKIIKGIEISILVTIYFYCFKLYKEHIFEYKDGRIEGFLDTTAYKKYKQSAIEDSATPSTNETQNDDSLSLYKQEIEDFFKNSNEYLESSFTQEVLADKTGISRFNISKTFNSEMNISFSDYLSKKRINYACNLLKEDINIPITQLAEEVGYKSRTTFYSNFKKVKGCTPKEYMDLLTL